MAHSDTQTIYLIRHARPDWTITSLAYHLPPGPPLTDEGQREARMLGDFLRRANVRRMYASPLERCTHTAQIAGAQADLDIQVNPALIEWQPGEDMAAVQERLRPAFEQAVKDARLGPVALITHGGPIAAQLMALGMDEATVESHRIYDHRNPLPTAGAWRARRLSADTKWELELVFAPDSESR